MYGYMHSIIIISIAITMYEDRSGYKYTYTPVQTLKESVDLALPFAKKNVANDALFFSSSIR